MDFESRCAAALVPALWAWVDEWCADHCRCLCPIQNSLRSLRASSLLFSKSGLCPGIRSGWGLSYLKWLEASEFSVDDLLARFVVPAADDADIDQLFRDALRHLAIFGEELGLVTWGEVSADLVLGRWRVLSEARGAFWIADRVADLGLGRDMRHWIQPDVFFTFVGDDPWEHGPLAPWERLDIATLAAGDSLFDAGFVRVVDASAEDAIDVLGDRHVLVRGGSLNVGPVCDTDELTFAGFNGVDEGGCLGADIHDGGCLVRLVA